MLSVILPTYNEAPNIRSVLDDIERSLGHTPFEVIIVDDDSPDGTWKEADALAVKLKYLRVIRRRGKRGLSSAVLEGFKHAKGSVFAVMDADGQHDSALLPALYKEITSGRADIAIGSRYIVGGSVGEWNERRFLMSRAATKLSMWLCRIRVRDPMSGFFAIRRSVAEPIIPLLQPRGFKILFDFLTHCPRVTRLVELPLTFGERRNGESKLNSVVQLAFLRSVYDVTIGRLLSLHSFLFLLLSLIILLTLLPRAIGLSPLYIDPVARTKTQQTLSMLADRQGWLLSDLSLLRVFADSIDVLHHSHSQFSAITSCYHISLIDQRISPCGVVR